jgi:YHS domain-containing protein
MTWMVMLAASTVACAEEAWLTSLDKARAEAERLNRPILCHFYGEWCAPCQKMERTTLNQPQVTSLLKTSVVGCKIDVDEHPEIIRRFGVDKFPTDIFIEPNGTHLLESSEYKTVEEYTGMIQRAKTRYMDVVASRQPKPQAPPVATTPATEDKDASHLAGQSTLKPMLDGYCPVTLWKHRRWVKGSPQFVHVYNGQQYYLSSEEQKKEFAQNPDRYVPRFLGCDPVVVWDSDRAVPGDTTWAAFYDEELYLFSSSENRKRFRKDPDKYTKTRVVLNVQDIQSLVR